MSISVIYGKTHRDYPAAKRDFSIRVRRQQPLGDAKFVVYRTGNPNQTLGAGTCPALHPAPNNYVEVFMRQGVPFTVQSVAGDLEIQIPGNVLLAR